MDTDYYFANKKAMLDYVIKDDQETERLGLSLVPKVADRRCIFPVYEILIQVPISAGRLSFPWHDSVEDCRRFMACELFVTHPVMQLILYDFVAKYVI